METEGRRQFRIGRCLGRGGFGEVYRATMRSPGGLETVVALKVLRADLDLQAEAVRRLRDEGRLLARITHPAVVRAHDLTRIDGRLALVTEFVEGEDLDDMIDGDRRIPPRALLEVVAQLAVALDAAWNTPGPDGKPLQVVHRDLKPTNVRIGRHGQVKLLDFGIARFTAGDRESRTASDVVVGSLPYMAPERFVERSALPASDVFGLGCLLFEGLSGQRFHEEGQLRALGAMALDPDRYGAHLRARIDVLQVAADLRQLVERCLLFDPARRPRARELATALEGLAEHAEGPPLRRWCAERSWTDGQKVAGELEGRTVTEGTLGIGPDPEAAAAPGRPVVIARPLGTIDPAALFGDGPSPAPGPARPRPVAPPAFPSIPVGMALHEGALSKDELDDLLRPTAPPAAPPPAAPAPVRRRRAPWVIAGVGCLALGSTGAGVALSLLIVLFAWLMW